MSKLRHNFTLSNEAVEKLKDVENKSEFVEEAVIFYHANRNKKEDKPQEQPKRLQFVVKEIRI